MKFLSFLLILSFVASCSKTSPLTKSSKHTLLIGEQKFELSIATSENGEEMQISSPLTNNEEVYLKLDESFGNKTYAGLHSKFNKMIKINDKVVQGLIVSPYYGLFINRVKQKLEQQGKAHLLGCPEITTKAVIFLVGSQQESVFACVI